MMITPLINEIKNNTELWEMLDSITTINKQLATFGSLESSAQEVFRSSNSFLLKENISTFCHEPIIKNIQSKKTDFLLTIRENSFGLLENTPKSISDFKTRGWFYSRIGFPNLISSNKIGAEFSEYYGFFNIIFNNSKLGDFVLEYLNDEGKDAYNKIYDSYNKYKFDKDAIVRKNITLNKGEEDPTIFGADHPKNTLSISAYSNLLSFRYNDYYENKYQAKTLRFIRDYSLRNENLNEESKSKLKQKMIEEYFLDAYLIHLNTAKIKTAIDEIKIDHSKNIVEYSCFLNDMKQILAKYYILAKM